MHGSSYTVTEQSLKTWVFNARLPSSEKNWSHSIFLPRLTSKQTALTRASPPSAPSTWAVLYPDTYPSQPQGLLWKSVPHALWVSGASSACLHQATHHRITKCFRWACGDLSTSTLRQEQPAFPKFVHTHAHKHPCESLSLGLPVHKGLFQGPRRA